MGEFSEALEILTTVEKSRERGAGLGELLDFSRPLQDIEPFSRGKGKWVARGHSGGGVYQGAMVACARVAEGFTPQEVVNASAAVLEENNLDFASCTELAGLRSDGAISIELSPNILVTNSGRVWDAPVQCGPNLAWLGDATGPSRTLKIVARYNCHPLVTDQHVDRPPLTSLQEELDTRRAIDALVVAGESLVLVSKKYTLPLSPFYPSLGGGAGEYLFEPIWIEGDIPAESLVQAHFAAYERAEFSSDELASLRLALDRVSRSRSLNSDLADRALDLGLALEILTMHGERNKSELNMRLSTRVALLLGGCPEERRSNLKAAKKLYDYRSAAAHTGRIETNFHEDQVALDRLVCRVASKIIDRGKFPVWQDIQIGIDD